MLTVESILNQIKDHSNEFSLCQTKHFTFVQNVSDKRIFVDWSSQDGQTTLRVGVTLGTDFRQELRKNSEWVYADPLNIPLQIARLAIGL